MADPGRTFRAGCPGVHAQLVPGSGNAGAIFVKLHHLTDITVRDDKLYLVDIRQSGSLWDTWMRPGRVNIPIDVLRANPQLHTALQAGINTALELTLVRSDRGAAELFGLEVTAAQVRGREPQESGMSG